MAPTHLKVFAVEAVGDLVVVTPQGDAEVFRYHEIHVETNSMLDFVARNRPQSLLIDFGAVGLVGSLMFASLVKLARRFEETKGNACFCSASEPMKQAMHSMRLTSRWPHFDSRDEALAYLNGDEGNSEK